MGKKNEVQPVQGQGQSLQGKSHTEHITNVTRPTNQPDTKLDVWKKQVEEHGKKR